MRGMEKRGQLSGVDEVMRDERNGKEMGVDGCPWENGGWEEWKR
jgi:hypothetical protein